MKRKHVRTLSTRGFSLVELLAIIAVIAILSGLILPALAHARIKSPAAGCLSTLRQMMTGWAMYRDDNNDTLMPNAPAGSAPSGWITGNSVEGWSSVVANTNAAALASGTMGAYVGNDVRVFKCPADVVPSANGQRLRSRSMNGQMGTTLIENPGWLTYLKGSDLTCPTPANAFIFCDEHPGSINDGYLQPDLGVPDFADVPASYHGNASGFGFADGHAEDHRWVTSVLAIPVVQGATFGGAHVPAGGGNADWIWFSSHTACKQH